MMIRQALERSGARTIFYTAAYGAYSFEEDFHGGHSVPWLPKVRGLWRCPLEG